MIPQVDSFEVLVWPNRIFGTGPGTYETVINSITGMFSELWRYPDSRLETGSQGIGVFIADPMGWQRGEPVRSNYDGFYSLTLPLVTHGIPVQVLSLGQVLEAGYLEGLKTLLGTYNYLKPSSAEINTALAEWCHAGGTLIFFGGTEPYNLVKDAGWPKAGYQSPGEHLFGQISFQMGAPQVHEYTSITLHQSDSKKFHGITPEKVEVSRAYPVTMVSPPAEANTYYSVYLDRENDPRSVIWQISVGKGLLIYTGIAPGFFSTLPAAVQILKGKYRR